MKGGNTDSKASEVQGYDYENVAQYGLVDMKGGKGKGKGKKGKSPKFSDFDFEKEWKEFEMSYNQKYGGAKKRKTSSTKKKPTKKASSSTKKKPAKKVSSSTKNKPKSKPQRGGDADPVATSAPAQFFDANAMMSAPSTGPFQSAYGTISNNNLAPYPNATDTQTGGAKKKKASKEKKTKTSTKTTKPKKDTKKKDSKKDTKSTGKKVSVLDKIKKFFAM